MWERLLRMDRRIIYGVLALVVVLPFVLKWQPPPGETNKWTRAVYDYLEKLPPGTPVLLSVDYQPAGKPELHPMSMALARHILSRNLRLVTMTLVPEGVLLAQEVASRTGKELGKEDGVDYVNLGWKPNPLAVMLGLGESVKRTFPRDAQDRPTSSLPVLQGVNGLKDFGLVLTISGTALPGTWVVVAHQKFKVPLATGVTAVNAPDLYVYLGTGQLVGMLNGIKGAAEYEYLIGHPDQAAVGLPAVSAVHAWVVLLVILGNVGYFVTRRQRGARLARAAQGGE